MEIILVAVIIILLISNSSSKSNKHKTNTTQIPAAKQEQEEQTIITKNPADQEVTSTFKPDYSKSYQIRYLLTKNEWYEYKKLRDIAEAKNLRVCPKVRLLDLVEPRRGEGYMSLLGKIQSKHVDFVISDRDMHIKAIVELDDGSHNRPDRQERDNFVDEVLTSVGYKVIRTRSIKEDTLSSI